MFRLFLSGCWALSLCCVLRAEVPVMCPPPAGNVLCHPATTPEGHEDWLQRLERKNRVGSRAARFAYIRRDGRRTTLRRTRCREYLLLFFYDPDCRRCREQEAVLQSDTVLSRLMAEGRLTVLAVCADADRETWERTKNSLPAHWLVGYDTGRIVRRDLYVFPVMPTLYLLDRRKRVVLKETTPEAVANHCVDAEE
ncbi:MAG: thioredoxin family protein [Clostridium sp.]|nr:thioredoxin family protein [Clostridium sp.]